MLLHIKDHGGLLLPRNGTMPLSVSMQNCPLLWSRSADWRTGWLLWALSHGVSRTKQPMASNHNFYFGSPVKINCRRLFNSSFLWEQQRTELKQTICGSCSGWHGIPANTHQRISIHCDSRINNIHEMQMRRLFYRFLSIASRESARTKVHVYPCSGSSIIITQREVAVNRISW